MKRSLSLVLLLLAACQTAVSPTNTPTPPLPTATLAMATAVPPTATPTPPDSGWQLAQPGLERRTVRLFADGQQTEQLELVRLDPSQFRFTIAYHPGAPQLLSQWQQETGALLVVNGGFFTPENVATGLIVVDGVASGSSYVGFGGMVTLGDGGVEIRSLAQRPYDPAEPLQYALQAFPMLVHPGGTTGFADEDGRLARRTVVAQDRNGRLLFMVATRSSFSLAQLSQWLLTSDLDLDVALNLDGGPSSGMVAGDWLNVPSFTAVPVVIAVYPKN